MKKNYCILAFLLTFCNAFLWAQGGSLDPSFNGSGILETKIQGNRAGFQRVRLQPDGKILTFGFIEEPFASQATVVRYHPDGALDSSFADNGVYATPLAGGSLEFGMEGLLLPNGKILLISVYIYSSEIALTQLLPNGSPDPAFGINGKSNIALPITMYQPDPYSCFTQPDGSIILSGAYKELSNLIKRGFALRVTPDGDLDNSFGVNGIVNFVPANTSDNLNIYGGKAQADGKIIVCGVMGTAPGSQVWYIARLLPDGALDTSFDGDGILTPNVGPTLSESAYAVLPLANGKLIVAGFGPKLPGQHMTIMRLQPDGALDLNFGLGGKAQVDFNCCHSRASDIVEQPDGKLVMAGSSDEDNEHYRFAVARIKANGFPDPEFGDLGKVVLDFQHDTIQSGFATSLLLQPDGKILASGLTSHVTGNRAVSGLLIRLNPGSVTATGSPNPAPSYQMTAYPNPLTDKMLWVDYILAETSEVSLSLYNAAGQKLLDFIRNEKRSGGQVQEALSIPGTIPNGTYFIRLETAAGSQMAPLVKAD